MKIVSKEGTFNGTTRGYGFVIIEGEEDIFIPERDTKGALHGDTVQVEITGGESAGKRREGKITKIIKHDTTYVVGTFEKSKSFGFVVPDNQKLNDDIFIKKKKIKQRL